MSGTELLAFRLRIARTDVLVLANDLADIEARWRTGAHAWLSFMFETWHSDIDLFSARLALAAVEAPNRQELEVV